MVAQMDVVELLKLQFSCCHAFVSTSSLFPGSISPAQWLRLQALDFQVSSGPCTFTAPPVEETDNRALWYDVVSLCSSSSNFASPFLPNSDVLVTFGP